MTSTAHDLGHLPTSVRRYLESAWAKDYVTAATCFTTDATVVDDGRTYDGLEAIQGWFGGAVSEWDYTNEATGSRQLPTGLWQVDVHVVGNFPGGVVDLTYTFKVTDDDRVRRLEIAA